MSKYGAKKTTIDGITFDSRAEARRHCQLLILERSNAITGLSRQVSFDLCPSVKFKGAARAKPALRYVADFVYTDCATGKQVVEDVKGVLTDVFTIKRHLMLAVHGIDILITK